MTHEPWTPSVMSRELSYSTHIRMPAHTGNNNRSHLLKDFPRHQFKSYQYGPQLPPSPAVLWHPIWPLCALGDFQPLKRWAGWEWPADLCAAFLKSVGTEDLTQNWMTAGGNATNVHMRVDKWDRAIKNVVVGGRQRLREREDFKWHHAELKPAQENSLDCQFHLTFNGSGGRHR